MIVEKVLDWRPFDDYTIDFEIAGVLLRQTWALAPEGDGTRVTTRFRLRRQKDRPRVTELRDLFTHVHEIVFTRLADTLAEDGVA